MLAFHSVRVGIADLQKYSKSNESGSLEERQPLLLQSVRPYIIFVICRHEGSDVLDVLKFTSEI